MGDKSCILVLGLDELASAVARRLLLAGYAVAMHAPAPPAILRRSMSFSDAWYDGAAVLEDVEARRADSDAEFLQALRSALTIPILTQRSIEAISRWPWDVVIDARPDPDAATRARIPAEMTIVLGPGAIAGDDCDIVIEIGGNDPGAVIRSASASHAAPAMPETLVHAPCTGLFLGVAAIGDLVSAGQVVGYVGSMPVEVPLFGRLRGLQRSGLHLPRGAPVAAITTDRRAPVDAIDRTHQLIARSIAFVIDREQQGDAIDAWDSKLGFRKFL